jgi:hypothetical protein
MQFITKEYLNMCNITSNGLLNLLVKINRFSNEFLSANGAYKKNKGGNFNVQLAPN